MQDLIRKAKAFYRDMVIIDYFDDDEYSNGGVNTAEKFMNVIGLGDVAEEINEEIANEFSKSDRSFIIGEYDRICVEYGHCPVGCECNRTVRKDCVFIRKELQEQQNQTHAEPLKRRVYDPSTYYPDADEVHEFYIIRQIQE